MTGSGARRADHEAPEAPPQAEDAQAAVQAVQAACREGDTERAVALIDQHWSILLEQRRDDLDEVFRQVPLAAFRAHPRAAALRDIRMHTSADAVERMLGPRISVPDPAEVAAIEALARSKDALTILGVASARMIAYRVRGHFRRARELAVLVERLARIAGVHQPALVHDRVPNALLQAAISRGIAGDLDGALGTLRESYERGPDARSEHIARDAAGKAALFSALTGDIDDARRWLRRYDRTREVDGWIRSRLELSADLARALVAIESLDRGSAEDVLDRVEQPTNSEQGWGPLVTYVIARHALIWGDRLRALERVRRDRARFADWLHAGAGLRPFLDHAEADLHLALRQGHRARSVGAELPDHPLAQVSRARLALLTGDFDIAARLASRGARDATDSRSRLDALTIQTSAHLRREQVAAARAAFDLLVASVASTGARAFLLYLSEEDRAALVPGHAAPIAEEPDRALFPVLAEGIRLTRQQRLVLDGIAAGRSPREISRDEHLSYNTVKTHVRALYAKLGASSRDQAIARAQEEGLL
ncbi:LuxR C-terminal-related transcriptional regulator [Ruania suaedae]|uniref:LuxR C-terminal-related transcriptional regulator n=1 Tax=Ruania suaedae TaxID=2897774 RepID=UPI001E61187B|nr:LuxR C-terminal-related transcriptional regulator [Ruania suaedae]UFU03760.1 LuxR C-terminal-related transcriptional regulator [Ruania suaedae]